MLTETVHIGDLQATIYSTPNPLYNILCVHGAGYTGVCWKPFIETLLGLLSLRILVVELRGHNKSRGSCSELSLNQLLDDVALFQPLLEAALPSFLIGHSLGGSLVARLAHDWPNCIGVCLLDITEGSALYSVSKMDLYLQNRPQAFSSVEEGAKWLFKTVRPTPAQLECIGEQVELKDQVYVWSIPLIESKPYWREWFLGMSEAFLTAPVDIRLLILAGSNEQLDAPLMKGQMQGQFQLHVLPQASHAIMLDAPLSLAQIIASNLKKLALIRTSKQT